VATAKIVYYQGYVQGIGFRYRAIQIAQTCDVYGYVKNLPDGRVELVAEGEEENVKDFLERVSTAMGSNISSVVENEIPVSGKYSGFRIAY